MIAGLGHHHIVDDPARGIGEHGIALPASGKVAETAWGEGLQQRGPIRAGQFYLPHVGNIKQAGLGAGVQMLLLDAARVAFQEARELRGGLRARLPDAPRVVYRHLITGKRDHARAMFQMELIQCCFLHVRFLMGCRGCLRGSNSVNRPRSALQAARRLVRGYVNSSAACTRGYRFWPWHAARMRSSMKGACHPAFLSLPRMAPFDFSARARLRATRLIMARFSGPFCLRLRARPSFMVTSSTQCRLFSMAGLITHREQNT